MKEKALAFALQHFAGDKTAGAAMVVSVAQLFEQYLEGGLDKAPVATPVATPEFAKPKTEVLDSPAPKPIKEPKKEKSGPARAAEVSKRINETYVAPTDEELLAQGYTQAQLDARDAVRKSPAYQAMNEEDKGIAESKAISRVRNAEKETVEKAAAKAAEAPADEPTADDVKATIQALLAANKRKNLIALFEKFGAKSFSSLKEADWAKFQDEAGDLLLDT